jgi:hypothetical protein
MAAPIPAAGGAVPASFQPKTKGEAIAAGKGWMVLRCRCKRVEMPFAKLKNFPDEMTLVDISQRFLCPYCQQRPDPKEVRAIALREEDSWPRDF